MDTNFFLILAILAGLIINNLFRPALLRGWQHHNATHYYCEMALPNPEKIVPIRLHTLFSNPRNTQIYSSSHHHTHTIPKFPPRSYFPPKQIDPFLSALNT